MPAISFLPFLQTVPFATRILTLTLILFTISGMGLSIFARQNMPEIGVPGTELPWLVMVPGRSWKFPWVLLTAGWVELSVLELVFSAISLPLACRYLERIWGPRELVRFCCVVIAGSNVIAFGFSWLIYLALGQEEALFGLPYHGLTGLQVGFLVAFTQLIPEHQLQFLGKLKIRVKTLPGIYLLLSNVLVVLLGYSPYILIQFGFFVAWLYLRFYKLSEDGLSRGDRSETFAFQYWFPPPIRPYISKGANLIHSYAVRLGVVQPWEEVSMSGSYAMLPGPGQARAEAERRRALALKALDARLASGSPAPGAVSSSALPTNANGPTSTASHADPPTNNSTSTITTPAATKSPSVSKAAAVGAQGDNHEKE